MTPDYCAQCEFSSGDRSGQPVSGRRTAANLRQRRVAARILCLVDRRQDLKIAC